MTDHSKSNTNACQFEGSLFEKYGSPHDPSKLDSSHTYHILVGRFSRQCVLIKIPLNEGNTKEKLIEKMSPKILQPIKHNDSIVINYKLLFLDITSEENEEKDINKKKEDLCLFLYSLTVPRLLIEKLKFNGIENGYFYVGKNETKNGQLPFSILPEEPEEEYLAKYNTKGEPAPFKTQKWKMADLLNVCYEDEEED